MLPHIEREQRHHAVMDQRRVGVVERGDPELAAVEHQPGPAVGEMVDGFLVELLQQRLGRRRTRRRSAARSLPVGLLPVGRREALPEEAVVPELGAVVEQLACRPSALAARMTSTSEAPSRPVVAEQLVGLVDIGAVMLAVVEFERFGRHVRRERVLGDRAVRAAVKAIEHLLRWQVQCTINERAAAAGSAPRRAKACDRPRSKAVSNPKRGRADAGGMSMGKLFENLNLTLVVGPRAGDRADGAAFHAETLSARSASCSWLHVFFGIIWIGLLYYFNFVQIPTMPTVPAELKPGVSKYIAPKALFYFRWGAAFTVLTGADRSPGSTANGRSADLPATGFRLIGIGMWLALIMAFNVWFIIWPNQKRALGLVEADDASKAKSARTAMLASRINTLLSIPML